MLDTAGTNVAVCTAAVLLALPVLVSLTRGVTTCYLRKAMCCGSSRASSSSLQLGSMAPLGTRPVLDSRYEAL